MLLERLLSVGPVLPLLVIATIALILLYGIDREDRRNVAEYHMGYLIRGAARLLWKDSRKEEFPKKASYVLLAHLASLHYIRRKALRDVGLEILSGAIGVRGVKNAHVKIFTAHGDTILKIEWGANGFSWSGEIELK